MAFSKGIHMQDIGPAASQDMDARLDLSVFTALLKLGEITPHSCSRRHSCLSVSANPAPER